MQLRIVTRTGHADFLDLPWNLPLAEWKWDRIVEIERGIGRHVVRFIDHGGVIYALKELPRIFAEREYHLLRRLEDESIPVVESVGLVTQPPGRSARSDTTSDKNAVLITRHLDFSLPYRALFARAGQEGVHKRLLDALVELLVRLHLAGFFWGDCSLSNALFRRDAGALAAYLVDAETGELHPQLSDGQRQHDVAIAQENVAGELFDLEAAGGGLPYDIDPVEVADALLARYESLWSELTREELVGPQERFRVDARLRRLNELGFDVSELELVAAGNGYRLRLDPHVVEVGHHRRRLMMLTGLVVQENQARRLLNDMTSFRAHVEHKEGRQLPEPVIAHRWLTEAFAATLAEIPDELGASIEPAEAFHEILEHRWYLSEAAGRDVGLATAARSYIESVLPGRVGGSGARSPDAGREQSAAASGSHDGEGDLEVHDYVTKKWPSRKKIALVAHDNKKKDLLEWARFNRDTLSRHDLYATGTTGAVVERELDLPVIRLQSGPLGGDQQIGAMIAQGTVDILVFFWDPLQPQPHDPDVKALLRMSVVWNIPVACNRSTADLMISSPLMSEEYLRLVPDHSTYAERRVDPVDA
jgi:methylglyoxal synthase